MDSLKVFGLVFTQLYNQKGEPYCFFNRGVLGSGSCMSFCSHDLAPFVERDSDSVECQPVGVFPMSHGFAVAKLVA